jgi:RHH-type transcriptional regulator, rel operon repressor / antitoxin RelB
LLRTKAFLVSKAIHAYRKNQAWQIEEIQKAFTEADVGEFATNEEVAAFLAGWQATVLR